MCGGIDMFIREKKIDCGQYREVDIIPRTDNAERAVKGKRGKRIRVTAPKQKDINEKNARRYLVQLGNGNFGKGDFHVSLTYSADNLPSTVEAAEKFVGNYLRKVSRRREKLGVEPLKYILVTEYKHTKDGSSITRIHHHIIMNGGLNRTEIEAMWTKERINWKKAQNDLNYFDEINQIGWANADRIQVDENGIEALCKYITKEPQGKKRWSSSRNLIRPEQMPNADSKYSKAKITRLATSADAGKKYFEKQFPLYQIVSVQPVYYDETGWHIYLKMWKKDDAIGKKRQRRKGEGKWKKNT